MKTIDTVKLPSRLILKCWNSLMLSVLLVGPGCYSKSTFGVDLNLPGFRSEAAPSKVIDSEDCRMTPVQEADTISPNQHVQPTGSPVQNTSASPQGEIPFQRNRMISSEEAILKTQIDNINKSIYSLYDYYLNEHKRLDGLLRSEATSLNFNINYYKTECSMRDGKDSIGFKWMVVSSFPDGVAVEQQSKKLILAVLQTLNRYQQNYGEPFTAGEEEFRILVKNNSAEIERYLVVQEPFQKLQLPHRVVAEPYLIQEIEIFFYAKDLFAKQHKEFLYNRSRLLVKRRELENRLQEIQRRD